MENRKLEGISEKKNIAADPIEALNRRYQQTLAECEQLRLAAEEEKAKRLEAEEKYLQQLEEEFYSNQEGIEILNELKITIKRLEAQNNYLRNENEEYQKKMRMIKETFVGKILVWGYRLLKKMKAKLGK